MKPKTKTVSKNEKLKTNELLLNGLRTHAKLTNNPIVNEFFVAAADRIEALVAALIKLEIKLKTK